MRTYPSWISLGGALCVQRAKRGSPAHKCHCTVTYRVAKSPRAREQCSERILTSRSDFVKYICFFLTNVVIYKQFQSNWSRISLKRQVQAKFLLKLVKICQKWSKSAKNGANLGLKSERFFNMKFCARSEKKTFCSPDVNRIICKSRN